VGFKIVLPVAGEKVPFRMQVWFQWDGANRNHIAEHGVSTEEAEQVVLNAPLYLERQLRGGEERTPQIGETDTGRVLFVVTTWREEQIRVVTAFPASRNLRAFYERQREEEKGGGVERS
jgi:hypothetical protein